MRFIDSHCHLDLAPLSRDIDGVVERARARGVSDIIVPSVDPASWSAVARLGETPGIHPAFGLHPWVCESPLDLDTLERHIRTDGAVAVGEIGLDFKVAAPRAIQMQVLDAQLSLAESNGLPVILHCRGAFEELFDILRAHGGIVGVVHAFSRGPELATRFVELGLHVAFGGAITHPSAQRVRRAAAAIPIDRLLLETDAPSIGLDGIPPEAVEPGHVVDVAASLADARGETFRAIANTTTANARTLFGID